MNNNYIDIGSPSYSLRNLYDTIGAMNIIGHHYWYRYYMPNRDDEEWDELEISFRIDHCQDKYFEHLMKSFFNTEVSVEYDPEQRGGFTGFFYKVRLCLGNKPPFDNEGNSPFSEFEIKQKVNKYIAEFRIFAIRAYNKEDAIRFYNS